jgi:superfamily I DNA/RNA helicase
MTSQKVHFLGGFDSYNFRSIVDARKLLDDEPGEVQDPFMRNFNSAADFEKYVDDAEELDLKTRLEIAKKYPNAEEVYERLRRQCCGNQNDADVVLTTAHKVKGQEFRHVHVLSDFLDVPGLVKKAQSKKDRTPVRAEELNLLYVAITRTLEKLSIAPDLVLSEDTISKFNRLVARGKIELY